MGQPDLAIAVPIELPGVNRLRDALILRARLAGKSIKETAQLANVAERTVGYTMERHREVVENAKREAQAAIAKRLPAMVGARVQDAENPESRTGPQSFKVLAEHIMGWHGRPSIHVGDNNVTIDARSINVDSWSRDGEREVRDRLGLD